ncbi:MAG: ATP-binding protein, partial [Vallitaleaceae bacterium]|nr:ATP-binding protein [Vallitaleaceae bacterium]
NAEVDRENKIINDLLTLVTLDRNENILRIREVVINEMIEGVLKRLKPLADQKNIEMLFESYRVIIAEIDEMKLDLALTNLIENAIKYNKEYGYINVILDTDFKDFIISVKDTGEGIPEENLDQIFRRFYRVDKTRSRETGGTGLGLSIVQKAVHMHKGSIRCKSELGQWSEFIVKIPLKQGNIPEVNTNEKMEE